MPYYDVSIPLKLKILTYYHESDEDLIGYAVTVPLKKEYYHGIVINKRDDKPQEVENIRKIEQILGQAYSKKVIEFLLWMSFYYVAEFGSVLRLTFFDEVVKYLTGKKCHSKGHSKNNFDFTIIESLPVKEQTVLKIIEAINKKEYKTFLLQSPGLTYESNLMLELAKRAIAFDAPILLILPEIREVKAVYHSLSNKIGDNIIMLHSEMRVSERQRSVEKIMNENVKVIVGTRFALFAPVKNLSLILLSQESSWLYKAEESPRYHTRESAIMRGFIEKCPVVLCDTLPSVSSYWNSMRGKFEYINDFNYHPHPEIIILKQPYGSIFHPETLLNLKLNEKEGALVISPRQGFSFLKCTECGEIIRCERCGYGMLFHKERKFIECSRCNSIKDSPEFCPHCGGSKIDFIGTGTERLMEELKRIFFGKQTSIKDYPIYDEQIQGIFISEAKKIKKEYLSLFKSAVFIDFDFFLSLPDYRAMENAFGKVLSLSHLIRNDGLIIIQTRNPDSDFFKFLRSYNFRDFYLHELKHRREAQFPPFVRVIKIILKLNQRASHEISERIKKLLKDNTKAEVIGPLEERKYGNIFFILRSIDKKKLTEEVHSLIERIKKIRGITLKIEVDPVSLKS